MVRIPIGLPANSSILTTIQPVGCALLGCGFDRQVFACLWSPGVSARAPLSDGGDCAYIPSQNANDSPHHFTPAQMKNSAVGKDCV